MSLAAGTRIGPYEIESLVGTGGMGEVYRARDQRLHRLVALKFVHGAPGDSEEAARLHHEARAAAALDHPFICKIYEVGQSGDATFIAMEFVVGQTLDRRLSEGPLPEGVALAIATEIAEGLHVAHQRGIVHRDLKPTNIMVADDGHVKLLDFGVAVKTDAHPGETTWLGPGAVAGGTLAYMAPEQLRGEPADRRSDLFAFGVVFTQLVTGRHPFGEHRSGIEIAAAILHEDPRPWPAQPAHPPRLAQVARKALAKQPADRYQSAADLLVDLRTTTGETLPTGASTIAVADMQSIVRRPRARTLALGAVGLVLAVAVAGVFLLWSSRSSSSIDPLFTQVTIDGNLVTNVIAPDGRTVAYVTQEGRMRQLRVRDIGGGPALELDHGPWLNNVVWLPDGLRLHYTDDAGGWTISRLGGARQPSFSEWPFAFSPDGMQIAFVTAGSRAFVIADAEGRPLGAPKNVDDAQSLTGVDWHGRSKRLLLRGVDTSGRHAIWTAPVDGRSVVKSYVDPGVILSAVWSPAADTIYFVRLQLPTAFELGALDVDRTGATTQRILAAGLPLTNDLSVSSDGTRLLQIRGQVGVNLLSVDLEHSAAVQPLTHGTASYTLPGVSREQRIVAVSGFVPPTSLVTLPMTGGEPAPILTGDGSHTSPAFSPDGRFIAFASTRGGTNGLWLMDADGRNVRKQATSAVADAARVGWLPDGRVLWQQSTTATASNFRIRDLATGLEEDMAAGRGDRSFVGLPEFSPDGSAVAVFESRADNPGLWIMNWPKRDERFLAANLRPIGWSADGQRIFAYASDAKTGADRLSLWQVSLKTAESRVLATLPNGTITGGTITPDHTHAILSVLESHGDAWMVEHFDSRARR